MSSNQRCVLQLVLPVNLKEPGITWEEGDMPMEDSPDYFNQGEKTCRQISKWS